MRVQHNITAMNAYRNYSNNTSALAKNLEKLSSGYKINRAGDDAAGLAISEKMRAQITGLSVAQKNAKDGISLIQTAEGALTEVHDMLNRMYELAEQSANGTYDNDVDRVQLQKELDQLRTEIDRIADSSNFNGINLLDGSMSTSGSVTELQQFSDLPETGDVLGTNTVLHKDAGPTVETAAFGVELHNTTFDNADGVSIKLKIGNDEFVYTGTGGDAMDAAAIVDAFVNGEFTDANGSAVSASAVTIGSTVYKASANGTQIKFTQVGGTTPDNVDMAVAMYVGTQENELQTGSAGGAAGTADDATTTSYSVYTGTARMTYDNTNVNTPTETEAVVTGGNAFSTTLDLTKDSTVLGEVADQLTGTLSVTLGGQTFNVALDDLGVDSESTVKDLTTAINENLTEQITDANDLNAEGSVDYNEISTSALKVSINSDGSFKITSTVTPQTYVAAHFEGSTANTPTTAGIDTSDILTTFNWSATGSIGTSALAALKDGEITVSIGDANFSITFASTISDGSYTVPTTIDDPTATVELTVKATAGMTASAVMENIKNALASAANKWNTAKETAVKDAYNHDTADDAEVFTLIATDAITVKADSNDGIKVRAATNQYQYVAATFTKGETTASTAVTGKIDSEDANLEAIGVDWSDSSKAIGAALLEQTLTLSVGSTSLGITLDITFTTGATDAEVSSVNSKGNYSLVVGGITEKTTATAAIAKINSALSTWMTNYNTAAGNAEKNKTATTSSATQTASITGIVSLSIKATSSGASLTFASASTAKITYKSANGATTWGSASTSSTHTDIKSSTAVTGYGDLDGFDLKTTEDSLTDGQKALLNGTDLTFTIGTLGYGATDAANATEVTLNITLVNGDVDKISYKASSAISDSNKTVAIKVDISSCYSRSDLDDAITEALQEWAEQYNEVTASLAMDAGDASGVTNATTAGTYYQVQKFSVNITGSGAITVTPKIVKYTFTPETTEKVSGTKTYATEAALGDEFGEIEFDWSDTNKLTSSQIEALTGSVLELTIGGEDVTVTLGEDVKLSTTDTASKIITKINSYLENCIADLNATNEAEALANEENYSYIESASVSATEGGTLQVTVSTIAKTYQAASFDDGKAATNTAADVSGLTLDSNVYTTWDEDDAVVGTAANGQTITITAGASNAVNSLSVGVTLKATAGTTIGDLKAQIEEQVQAEIDKLNEQVSTTGISIDYDNLQVGADDEGNLKVTIDMVTYGNTLTVIDNLDEVDVTEEQVAELENAASGVTADDVDVVAAFTVTANASNTQLLADEMQELENNSPIELSIGSKTYSITFKYAGAAATSYRAYSEDNAVLSGDAEDQTITLTEGATAEDVTTALSTALENINKQANSDAVAAGESTYTATQLLTSTDDAGNTTYSIVTYAATADAGASDGELHGDYNVSIVEPENPKTGAAARLASTFISLDSLSDIVENRSVMQIGDQEYTFTTNVDKMDDANSVYIGDLVDEEGNLEDGSIQTVADRLSVKANDNNTVWTVGVDGNRVTFTEKVTYADTDGEFDLTTFDGVKESLGYRTAGDEGNGLTLQIGDTSASYNQMTVDINDCHAVAMGIGSIDISTQDGAAKALTAIKNAINYVSDVRGTLGATQNRLDHTINNLSVMEENIQDAESTIRDTDIAEEMMEYTKNSILVQSAQAMLAQANQLPQGVLQLLQ